MDKCPGCENNCEFKRAHINEWGYHYPSCHSRLAEIERIIYSDTIMEYNYNYEDYSNYDIIMYINEYIVNNYVQEYLYYYANCNCCERHQKLKPIYWGAWNDYRIPKVKQGLKKGEKECDCNCRFMARSICRLYSIYE